MLAALIDSSRCHGRAQLFESGRCLRCYERGSTIVVVAVASLAEPWWRRKEHAWRVAWELCSSAVHSTDIEGKVALSARMPAQLDLALI